MEWAVSQVSARQPDVLARSDKLTQQVVFSVGKIRRKMGNVRLFLIDQTLRYTKAQSPFHIDGLTGDIGRSEISRPPKRDSAIGAVTEKTRVVRSEDRSTGKAGGSRGRSRWSALH